MAVTGAWLLLTQLPRESPVAAALVRAILSFLLAVVLIKVGFEKLRQDAALNASLTNAFSNNLDSMVLQIKADPTCPVVFVSHQPLDFEPLCSLHVFFRARGITNAIFIRLEGYDETYPSPLLNKLANVLTEISQKGEVPLVPFPRVQPLADLPVNVTPFEIDFITCWDMRLRTASRTALYQPLLAPRATRNAAENARPLRRSWNEGALSILPATSGDHSFFSRSRIWPSAMARLRRAATVSA
jgi:hypothetical protein